MLWLRIWVVEWYGVVWNSRRSVLIINRWHSSKQILTMFLSRQKSQSTEGRRGGLLAPPPRYTWDGMGTMAPPTYASTRVWGHPDPVIRFPDKLESSKSVLPALWLGGECDVKPDCDMCNVQKPIFRASVLVFPFLLLSFLMLETCNWICSVAPLLFGDSQ